MLPGTCQEDLLCVLLVWISILLLRFFLWGRIWLLVHCQHKPEHIRSIPFCLIWLLVSSIHMHLLLIGCNLCRAGDSPTWLLKFLLMILIHKYTFSRPWCYPPPNQIWVLPRSIRVPCILLLGKHFYVTCQYVQSIQCCNFHCNLDWLRWEYRRVLDWRWFSSDVSASH